MAIHQICAEIIQICDNKERMTSANKQKLYLLFTELSTSLKPRDKASIVVLLECIHDLQSIKNHKARFMETEIFTRLLPQIPLMARMDHQPQTAADDLGISEEEIAVMQLLLDFVKGILKQKPNSSKRSSIRVAQSIAVVRELHDYYGIAKVKEIFWHFKDHQDTEVQFQALLGLENCYPKESAPKITKVEIEQLEALMHQTTGREVAVTCCQILINAGVIDEMGALVRMDDWKSTHY